MAEDKTLPTLFHKGYVSRLWYNEKDRNRIYGSICKAETPDVVAVDTCFAGDNIDEVKERFIQCVERHINIANFKSSQSLWKSKSDYLTIAAVYNILPKVFRTRILEGNFDKSVIDNVKGGFYEVPLYFVTKAWDYILNGSLCGFGFSIGPWHNKDKGDWYDFIVEERPNRFRCQAIANNNEMKQIWLEYFGIDIDAIDIDFSLYNRHLTPNVSSEDEYYFFQDVPDGVEEYILGPINRPSPDYVYLDTVSDLMEYAAFLNRNRPEYGDLDD